MLLYLSYYKYMLKKIKSQLVFVNFFYFTFLIPFSCNNSIKISLSSGLFIILSDNFFLSISSLSKLFFSFFISFNSFKYSNIIISLLVCALGNFFNLSFEFSTVVFHKIPYSHYICQNLV